MFGRLIRPPKTPRPAPKSVFGQKGVAPSVLAADVQILGNIIGDGVLDIDAQIDGNVRSHTVSVRANGRVRGDVTAEIAHIHGVVEGTVRAKTVMLYASAKVIGIVMHEALTIEDGAFIDGQCKRTDKIFIDEHGREPSLTSAPLADDEISFAPDIVAANEENSDAEVTILNNLRIVL